MMNDGLANEIINKKNSQRNVLGYRLFVCFVIDDKVASVKAN